MVDASRMMYQTHEPGKPGMSDSFKKLARLRLPDDLRGKRVLDIGCNEGLFCRIAKERGAERVVGIDFDSFRMDAARERYGALGIDFRLQTWDRLPEGEFDYVIWASGMQYEPDPRKVTEQVLQCLAADGTFILECGVVDSGFSETRYFVRHSDVRSYPTITYLLEEILDGFAARDIAPAEMAEGDPVPRMVFHCRRAKPEILIVRGGTGDGKSSFAQRNFRNSATKTIHLDHVISWLALAKFAPTPLVKFLQENLNPKSLGPLYVAVDEHGLTEEYVALIVGLVSPHDRLTVIEGFLTDRQLEKLKRLAVPGYFVWEAKRIQPQDAPW